jgi:uncharacterized protein
VFVSGDGVVISPSDLVDLLECGHRSALKRALAFGVPDAPRPTGTVSSLVAEHGLAHEEAVLERFRTVFGARGVVEIGHPAPDPVALRAAAEQTDAALRAGAPVVYQGVFFDGSFYGRADFLVSTAYDPDTGVRRQARHGAYEPYDTKLARHAKPAAVLQLTAYADALTRSGHGCGEHMHLLLGDGSRQSLRVADFTALLADLRERLAGLLVAQPVLPLPRWAEKRPACETCAFAEHCATGRETDRDLSLVAGLRGDQRRKLHAAGITTIDALAGAEERPSTLSTVTFEHLRAQAALQVTQDATRTPEDPTGTVRYDVVGPDALATLPLPSPGDIFFDMEGDPYSYGGAGLEYLFGAVTLEEGEERFTPFWAHSRAEEKTAFEAFVDFAVARLATHPGGHIYHYAPYEVTALKRLAAQHGTREEGVADLLRAGALVDLYAVVRKALRVSQRSYSIKYLEPLYMDAGRTGDVVNAGASIEAYEAYVTAEDAETAARVLAEIGSYNEYDCVSTHRLFRWLHGVREEHRIAPHEPAEQHPLDKAIADATDEDAIRKRRERAERLAAITGPLLDGLPEDPAEYTPDDRARALLAGAAGYHRRETDPAWWEYFRLCAAPLADLESESSCAVPVSWAVEDWVPPTGRKRTAKRLLHVRCDPERPHPFAPRDKVRLLYPAPEGGWTRNAVVEEASGTHLVIEESAKPDDTGLDVPIAVLPGPPVQPNPKDVAVEDLARNVAESLPEMPALCGVDLLRREGPRLSGGRPLPRPEDHDGDLVRTVIAAVYALDDSTLAVQGPPGAGKTYLAGQLICHLVAHGRTVGVTSNSHKAVENVMMAAVKAAGDRGMDLPAAKRPKSSGADPDAPWEQPKSNAVLAGWRAEHEGGHLVGGTAWNFAADDLRAQPFDVLIVDEAGQFALADALAVSTATRNLVLLGDPQQLPQVVQGTHPEGADASALGHLLGDHDVIPPELGYFLDVSRRMHPDVCAPVSRLSYAGLLHSHECTHGRRLDGVEPGLYVASVEHTGNTTSSPEEADTVVALVTDLIGRPWTDEDGTRPLGAEDVLVVAPYNVQVRLVQRRLAAAGLEDVRVGTVDRFQGQEAPVVVTTMTSSSSTELPRGLDFLLSRNRVNVALSRAQAVAVLVCSPALVSADARSVAAMRLISGMVGLIRQARKWAAGS